MWCSVQDKHTQMPIFYSLFQQTPGNLATYRVNQSAYTHFEGCSFERISIPFAVFGNPPAPYAICWKIWHTYNPHGATHRYIPIRFLPIPVAISLLLSPNPVSVKPVIIMMTWSGLKHFWLKWWRANLVAKLNSACWKTSCKSFWSNFWAASGLEQHIVVIAW